MRALYTKLYTCCVALLLITAINVNYASAQQAQINLELQVNESLANSQVINLTNIIASNGSGANLFNIFIENLDTEATAQDLYLNVSLQSDKNGLIADLYQKQGQPFSLDPGQSVFATNNTIENGLPGVEESINFDGGLTTQGEEFVNDLGGSTKLPPDRYVIQIDIYQNANGRNGGVLLATAQAEIGGGIVDEVRDIFLTSPGDAVGSEAEITNPYPEFRWEGGINTQYRLIVVEANNQDGPETLIQSSVSTEPILENGSPGTGSLLQYEILDVRIQGTSFQMPPSGVQNLEEEKLYYWQVFAELSSSSGTDIRNSEIWGFILKGHGAGLTISSGGELGAALQALMESGELQELQNGGFKLGSIVIDEQTISGPAMLQRLIEFQNKVNNGEITIVNN
ncbi:MAG: hypothetical protein U5J95_08455 [Balneolaceae bacterium]|nr:hypothetical protein [Balneolaceae bacterium]